VPFCGGPLHYACYERKPRGGPPDLPEAYSVRFSLCCGRPGCRRRVLPASVLFWGRRVYWAPVLLVVTALRQGRDRGYTVRRLQALFGLTRPTLARWIGYFRQQFPHSLSFRRLSGRLMPPVAIQKLPGTLMERFVRARGEHEAALVACLQALAPGP
jgi:hypothetical protein